MVAVGSRKTMSMSFVRGQRSPRTQLQRDASLAMKRGELTFVGAAENAGQDRVGHPRTPASAAASLRTQAWAYLATAAAKALVRWGACGLRSPRLKSCPHGPAGAQSGPEQLTLQPIRDGHGQGSRPSSVGYRLAYEVVANVARVGVPDRPFRRRDRHPLDTLDVLGGK